MERHDSQTPDRPGFVTRLLARIGGVDVGTLAACPPQDQSYVSSFCALQVFTAIWQTFLFSVVVHHQFAKPGELRWDFIAGSAFVAVFLLRIDALTMQSVWYLNGVSALKKGGLDLSGGFVERFKGGAAVLIRVFFALDMAQLATIFLSLLIYSQNIDARIDSDTAHQNASLVAEETRRIDGDIQYTRDDAAAKKNELSEVAAEAKTLRRRLVELASSEPQTTLAQAEAAQILNSKVKAAARAHLDALRQQLASTNETARQQASEALSTTEKDIETKQAELTTLETRLTEMMLDRDEAIQKAVKEAPGYVRKDKGLLAQISALRHIAEGNAEIKFMLLIIEIASLIFEMAVLLAKLTSIVQTSYAALIVRNSFMRNVRIVDLMVAELEARKDTTSAEPASETQAANDNQVGAAPPTAAAFETFDDPPPPPSPPPRRGRGRPRKAPVTSS